MIPRLIFIAELQRAKRASEAPWVNRVGNPSSRENLVMTSAYQRANAVRTDSGGGGGASRGRPHGEAKECHLSGFFRKVRKKPHFYLFIQQRIGEVDLTFSR